MYRVEYDPAANLVRMHVRGFWKLEDVPALAAAVGVTVREARAARDDFDVIVESLEFPVQGGDVAGLLTSIMVGGMAQTRGRAAVVVGSQLNKLQAERTLAHPRLQVFRSMAEAQQWLAAAA